MEQIGKDSMICGRCIALRAVLESDLPLLQGWSSNLAVQGPFNIFALRPTNAIAASFAQDGFLSDQQGLLLIVREAKEVVGYVGYRQMPYGPTSGTHPYNIGLSILEPHRRQGYGTEAQRLLAAYLFATYPIMRVEAFTEEGNIAERGALEKAGFTREGLLRKALWRAGAWRDLLVYSKLRDE